MITAYHFLQLCVEVAVCGGGQIVTLTASVKGRGAPARAEKLKRCIFLILQSFYDFVNSNFSVDAVFL